MILHTVCDAESEGSHGIGTAHYVEITITGESL